MWTISHFKQTSAHSAHSVRMESDAHQFHLHGYFVDRVSLEVLIKVQKLSCFSCSFWIIQSTIRCMHEWIGLNLRQSFCMQACEAYLCGTCILTASTRHSGYWNAGFFWKKDSLKYRDACEPSHVTRHIVPMSRVGWDTMAEHTHAKWLYRPPAFKDKTDKHEHRLTIKHWLAVGSGYLRAAAIKKCITSAISKINVAINNTLLMWGFDQFDTAGYS